MLTDTESNTKYRVIVNGKILAERDNMNLANAFLMQLSEEQQQHATIVPITSDGKEFLFG
jgi:hypothetical protein